jgi:L-lactate utilization protein LutB
MNEKKTEAIRNALFRKLGDRTVKNLRRNLFEAEYVGNSEEARTLILRSIKKADLVGLGDSITLEEIGLISTLENGDYRFLNPWKPGITRSESMQIRRQALTSDIFLTGTNALTLDGRLVNIDGLGNRVAGVIFGPKKVIIVVGANKIVTSVEEGISRIKRIAAPMNAIRHDFKPEEQPGCTHTGICNDCKPPRRICCNTVIIEGCSRDPYRTKVIIVGEELGY